MYYPDMMDAVAIETGRELLKIAKFLDDMVEQERMTAFERELVKQEAAPVSQAAGYRDARGNYTGVASGDELTAVLRHQNHLKKKKIGDLHPELKDELERYIAYRPYHPLPPVAGSFARQGVALQRYRALLEYIDEKRHEGVISVHESHIICEPAIRVFEDSGVFLADLDEQTDKAVIARAYHLVKARLLDLHPELAGEVRLLRKGDGPSSSRSR